MAAKLNTYHALHNNERDEEIIQCDAGFTFIDLLPRTIVQGRFFTSTVYESFRTLFDRANEFLRRNRKWKIVTCESVKFRVSFDEVHSVKTTYIEDGDSTNYFVRGLRLWLTESKDEKEREQQIGYFNLIPKVLEKGGIVKSPKFETLDMVIERFNSQLQSNPLPGRIFNIESEAIKISDINKFDPDISSWDETGGSDKRFLFVIRIFYEYMADSTEEIGVQDIVPDQTYEGDMFTWPEYARFSLVVNKASTWCAQQRDFRFCNAQTLAIKVKIGRNGKISNEGINSQRMDYTEDGKYCTSYVRLVRIAYTKPLSSRKSISEKPPPIRELTCRTFVPVQLIADSRKYEDLAITRERISAWVKATGVRVLNAETTTYRVMSSTERNQGSEATFSNYTGETDYTWMYVIRLYIDGLYKEPPPEKLPEVPALKFPWFVS